MLERMRGVKVFVLVESAPNTERRPVAVASVRQLRWALARRYPKGLIPKGLQASEWQSSTF